MARVPASISLLPLQVNELHHGNQIVPAFGRSTQICQPFPFRPFLSRRLSSSKFTGDPILTASVLPTPFHQRRGFFAVSPESIPSFKRFFLFILPFFFSVRQVSWRAEFPVTAPSCLHKSLALLVPVREQASDVSKNNSRKHQDNTSIQTNNQEALSRKSLKQPDS